MGNTRWGHLRDRLGAGYRGCAARGSSTRTEANIGHQLQHSFRDGAIAGATCATGAAGAAAGAAGSAACDDAGNDAGATDSASAAGVDAASVHTVALATPSED